MPSKTCHESDGGKDGRSCFHIVMTLFYLRVLVRASRRHEIIAKESEGNSRVRIQREYRRIVQLQARRVWADGPAVQAELGE